MNYIVIIESEVVASLFGGRQYEIRYATEAEVDRFLEYPSRFLPDGYVEDDDGDLWISAAVHFQWKPSHDRRVFALLENLLHETDTHLLRGYYEGLLEFLGADRKAEAHVVDKRARRVV